MTDTPAVLDQITHIVLKRRSNHRAVTFSVFGLR
jgi:hypothetical protein